MTRARERCGALFPLAQPPHSGTAANPCSQQVTETLAPYRERARPQSPPRDHLPRRGDGSRHALEG